MKAVNTGQVDTQGNLVKVPIIVYHRVGEGGVSVSQSLLDREMKYLKNNGFTTLTMDDIEYNPTTNRFQSKVKISSPFHLDQFGFAHDADR